MGYLSRSVVWSFRHCWDGDQVFRIEPTAGHEHPFATAERNLCQLQLLEPSVAVLFRQVEKKTFRFHRGACLKERLHQVRPQRSESLEEEIGVLIFGIGGREMLDKFERSTLRG